MFIVFAMIDILVAYVIDLLVGDPHWMPHPVRFIGWLVKRLEKILRHYVKSASGHKVELAWGEGLQKTVDRKAQEKKAGIMLAASVTLLVFLLVFAILKLADLVHPVLFHILNIYFIYSALATRCLADETYKVSDALIERDVFKAQGKLSMLVGRDTEGLSEREIIRGAVETVAENTVDGVISPLLYAVLGSFFGLGAPLAYAFKAVSTLDSMVGYMNDKYIYFGWASAKLDDAANYIPARLSGVVIPASAYICKKNYVKSFNIMRRDRRNHKSPNSGYPEAAVAGALGVMLGGPAVYFGEVVEKPTIGDPDRELVISDVHDTIKLMYVASMLTLGLGIVVSAIIVPILT